MIKIIAIGGEPASGKTFLFRRLLSDLAEQPKRAFQLAKMRGVDFPNARVVIFGVYDQRTFAGTDALSMAVQPETVAFLEYANRAGEWNGYKFYFEGDRLFNQKFFAAMDSAGIKTFRFVLTVAETDQRRRFMARGSNQPEKFLKGQRTKLARLCAAYPPEQTVELRTEAEAGEFAQKLFSL